MVAVESVRMEPCPSCSDDPTQGCDRCDNGRVIAVVENIPVPLTREQIIAKNLAAIRRKLES